jgi:hexosaminidase
VEYGTRLAIRVIPEFDNPGHSRAIGFDPYFTEIVRCFNDTESYKVPNAYEIKGTPLSAPLDPSMEKTYEAIQGILTEMNELFPDSHVHMGGDEVDTACYDENPGIQDFMKKHGIANYSELVVSHIARVRQMVSKLKPKGNAIYWSDPGTFYQRYRDGDILMYWGGSNKIDQLKSTYPNNSYVMAPVDFYYLDCSFGNKYGGKSWCDPMKTFWRIYSYEPSMFFAEDDNRMLGAEVPVWSEIMSAESFEIKVWPRAAAMADRMWGKKNTTTVDMIALVQRQVHFANYLTARGVPAGHNTGAWCEAYPEHCFAYPINKQEESLELDPRLNA